MENKKYSEKLKHPNWQKKRLEILQRDNFTCRSCLDKDKTLHVHHTYYDEDLDIWGYENDDLITLCSECHKTWHFIYSNPKLNSELIPLVTKLHDYLEYNTILKSMKRIEADKLANPEKYINLLNF